jgi:hypothetical protein
VRCARNREQKPDELKTSEHSDAGQCGTAAVLTVALAYTSPSSSSFPSFSSRYAYSGVQVGVELPDRDTAYFASDEKLSRKQHSRGYVFDPVELAVIVRRVLAAKQGSPVTEIFRELHKELLAKYPGQVSSTRRRRYFVCVCASACADSGFFDFFLNISHWRHRLRYWLACF